MINPKVLLERSARLLDRELAKIRQIQAGKPPKIDCLSHETILDLTRIARVAFDLIQDTDKRLQLKKKTLANLTVEELETIARAQALLER
jgi:fumarylacetoacetate (FAA) hydrolase family protein